MHRLVFRVLSAFGVTNLYWNTRLKEHGAFHRRFDAPYTEARPGV
jgi:hypothetical protein